MTEDTLREELAAKTRALELLQAQLACLSASCGVCRACVLRSTEVERDRAITTGDTLRAQLAEAQKEIKGLRLAAFELYQHTEAAGDTADRLAVMAGLLRQRAADAKRIAGPIIDKVFDAAERAEQAQTPKETP